MKTKMEKASLEQINAFMAQKNMAIVGVSRNDKKFGNALVKDLKNKDYQLYVVHPQMDSIYDVRCYQSIAELPDIVSGVIICTKPDNTLELVKQALDKGINHIFLQQGAQNDEAIRLAINQGANLIHRRCALMFAEPVGSIHKFHRTLSKLFGAYPK